MLCLSELECRKIYRDKDNRRFVAARLYSNRSTKVVFLVSEDGGMEPFFPGENERIFEEVLV